MRKTIVFILIMVLALMAFATVTNAMTQAELKEYILSKHEVSGHQLELTSAEKKQVEDYFDTHEITEIQANVIKTKAEECIAIMNNAGVTQVQQLSKEDKQKLLSLAQEAAEAVGLKVDMSTGLVTDASGEPVFKLPEGKLVQTGSNNIPLIIAGIAIIAVAGTVIYKKARA